MVSMSVWAEGLDHSRGCCNLAAHPFPSVSRPSLTALLGFLSWHVWQHAGSFDLTPAKPWKHAVDPGSLLPVIRTVRATRGCVGPHQHWVSAFVAMHYHSQFMWYGRLDPGLPACQAGILPTQLNLQAVPVIFGGASRRRILRCILLSPFRVLLTSFSNSASYASISAPSKCSWTCTNLLGIRTFPGNPCPGHLWDCSCALGKLWHSWHHTDHKSPERDQPLPPLGLSLDKAAHLGFLGRKEGRSFSLLGYALSSTWSLQIGS